MFVTTALTLMCTAGVSFYLRRPDCFGDGIFRFALRDTGSGVDGYVRKLSLRLSCTLR